jgi:UbiD family decarboxylase
MPAMKLASHTAPAALAQPGERPQRTKTDLRAFIDLLERHGRLRRIEHSVDWRFELGKITRDHHGPILFENIKDYPGARVFTNGLSEIENIALALGLDSRTGQREIVAEARRRLEHPFKPILVETGPVTENVTSSDAVNLPALPIPHWHEQDAGRYVGTWHINVTKDPETEQRNVGVYRMQLLGPRQATVSASPKSHLSRHVAKAEKMGQPLEMAVAIGVNECMVMAASAGYPYGWDEYELAGALQQRSIRLIPCQSLQLEIPAESEIVLEGAIQPGVRVTDGPYFDYAGKTDTNHRAFLFEATGMMFRERPIFRGASVGVAGAEDHQLFAFLAALDLVDFHGKRLRQLVQNQFLRMRQFRAFQFAGRIGSLLGRAK